MTLQQSLHKLQNVKHTVKSTDTSDAIKITNRQCVQDSKAHLAINEQFLDTFLNGQH